MKIFKYQEANEKSMDTKIEKTRHEKAMDIGMHMGKVVELNGDYIHDKNK